MARLSLTLEIKSPVDNDVSNVNPKHISVSLEETVYSYQFRLNVFESQSRVRTHFLSVYRCHSQFRFQEEVFDLWLRIFQRLVEREWSRWIIKHTLNMS